MSLFDIFLPTFLAFVVFASVAIVVRVGRDYGPMPASLAGIFFVGCLVFLVVIGRASHKEEKAEDDIRAGETYVDHVARWERTKRTEQAGPAWPEVVAFTTTSVRLRDGPSQSAKVRRTVPMGTRIKVFHLSPAALPPRSGEGRVGDWFQVNCEGDVGWIHGRYLRPALRREGVAQVADTGRILERALVPEKILGGKLLGLAVGIAISVAAALIRVPENIEFVRSAAPISYFMARGWISGEFTPLESILTLFCCALVASLLDILTRRIVRLARQ